MTREKIKQILITAVKFVTNPRFLLCFGIAWMITNGIGYASVFIGSVFDITWLTTVAGAYAAFLLIPFTPEKIVTFTIAIFILKWLFPNDKRTLAVMMDLLHKAKAKWVETKSRLKGKGHE